MTQLIDYKKFSGKVPDQPWIDGLLVRLNQLSEDVRFEASINQGYFNLRRFQHGMVYPCDIPLEFFTGTDFELLADLAETLNDLIQTGAEVHRGQQSSGVDSFAEAYEWLMEQSRKGHSITRFKGLGEMNPDQLWDTTVNPETRRLLQVTIEDAVAAHEIFSTLMGDEVVPRREFIESNALNVNNLDI